MLATQRWKQMVQAEHAQSERAMGGVSPPEDRWRPYAQQFKSDPRRTGDGLVNRLREEVAPHHTLLDVGAGGGRLALPAAIHCRSVVAVEPSPSMGEVLRQQASESSISNVSVVQARWEEAEVEPADLVLCAHVLYVVADIETLRAEVGRPRQRAGPRGTFRCSSPVPNSCPVGADPR